MSTRPSDGTPARRRICVFCASSMGSSPEYAELASRVGRTLVERGYGVVYGGANRGLMGEVADAALEAGGEVLGVLPYGLQAMEVAHEGLTQLEIVDTLHERKARMMELSSGFLVLPGGHGTLEEFFEVLTWLQLAIHDHPVGVLNHAGFYDHILAHLDHVVTQGLLRPEHRSLLLADHTLDGVLDAMEAYQAPPRPTWNTRPRP